MSDSVHLLDILFFAVVAAFLVFRLRSVLGRRTGNERPPTDWRKSSQDAKTSATVIDLADVRKAAIPAQFGPSQPGADGVAVHGMELVGLGAIGAADPNFRLESFLEGARAAFTMIVGAYAAGDTRSLRPLLSDEVYRNFAGAIDVRTKAGERLETEIRDLAVKVVGAGLDGTVAYVTVRFTSRQINVVRDATDRVIDGEPGRAVAVIDEWSFRRDTRSPDPNWQLVATSSPEG